MPHRAATMMEHRQDQGHGRAHRLGVCRDRAGLVQEEDGGPLRRDLSQEHAWRWSRWCSITFQQGARARGCC